MKCRLLFDGKFGVVAVAGDDSVLLRMAFFVLHAEGVALVVDEEDFDVAIAAVVLVIGGAVGEDVLVADGIVDCTEDLRQRTLEHWAKAHASGECREGLELILGLEVIEFTDSGPHAATTAGHLV